MQPYIHGSRIYSSQDMDFPGGSDSKASAYNEGDPDSILGLGRSPEEGNGNPLEYSCLENPWTEEPGRLQSVGSQSRTRLRDFTKVKDTFIRTQPKCPLMDEWIKKMWQIYIYIYIERGIFLLLMLFSH